MTREIGLLNLDAKPAKRIQILKRPPVLTLSQIPLCLARMLDRAEERAQRVARNRAFFRRLFGLDRRGTKPRRYRLGTFEQVDSNLPLR